VLMEAAQDRVHENDSKCGHAQGAAPSGAAPGDVALVFWRGPLWSLKGAAPTRAATSRLVKEPSSGHKAAGGGGDRAPRSKSAKPVARAALASV
jgi:hypothetical protein